MPTVILLDVSLSMARPVSLSDASEEYQRRHLAIHGVNTFLDFLAASSKLEFVSLEAYPRIFQICSEFCCQRFALSANHGYNFDENVENSLVVAMLKKARLFSAKKVIFSSRYEVVSSFTRDYDVIRGKLANLEEYDKTSLETGLSGVANLVADEWGFSVPCHVVLVTDGALGLGSTSFLQNLNSLHNKDRKRPDFTFPLPFPFPSKLHILNVATSDEPCLTTSLPVYHKLVEVNGGEGGVYVVTEGPLSFKSVQSMFIRLADTSFAPFQGTLRCGSLLDTVSLYPAPPPFHKAVDFDIVQRVVSKELEICGFIDLTDIASPPAYSRHLVLPISNKSETNNIPNPLKMETDAEEEAPLDDSNTPSFCALLHGSLKVENMAALCQVAEDWFGLLYSWADTKKKSNLMLSLFEPGYNAIPWLGPLSQIGPLSEFRQETNDGENSATPFPVKAAEKRSYAQCCVVWVRPAGLQGDVQKILRHARKMPDKTQHFYKELNRLRRAALAFGFLSLLEALAAILERECTLLPGSAHPDCALQLSHAANMLRQVQARDLRHNITALRTKFGGHGGHDD